MPIVHLIEGPVGAGKSTYAGQLGWQAQAPRLILDQWMTTLFRPDRPVTATREALLHWYGERKQRCLHQIWHVASDIVEGGGNVILELGLIRRNDRYAFYQRVDDAGFSLTVHCLDAPREVRRARVQKRNEQRGATFAMEVPDDIFQLASDLWEAPDESEIAWRDIRLVNTG